MLTKIALLLLAAYLAWRLLRPRRLKARPKLKALEAVRCPRCGMYRLPGRPCACPDDGAGPPARRRKGD